MRKSSLLSVLLCLLSLSVVKAQEANSILGYINHVMLFNKTMPQEKIYLHFDNTGYFKGERMWYKAYVVNASDGRPTRLSRVLYVEMLDPSGNVVKKQVLKIKNGESNGDFQLDSLYVTGFYEVRAYTRYMLNFGNEAGFSRVFPIFKQPKAEGDYSQPTIDQLGYRRRPPERAFEDDSLNILEPLKGKRRKAHGFNVNFYPEGGNLIVGQRSRVALEVTDHLHRPVEVRGVLNSSDDSEMLAYVQTNADGRSIFEMIPDENPLHLILTDSNGKLHSFDVPAALSEGLTIRVNTLLEDVVEADLCASDSLQGHLLGMVVMNGGVVNYADTFKVEQTMSVEIPRSSLRPGVNQLTFFGNNGQILADRLFFIYPNFAENNDSIGIISLSESRPAPCGKVSLEFVAKPHTRFSFTAVDSETQTNGADINALNWMLLGSELRGYIAHPQYYLESDDRTHRLAADTLMMVQGWRRYDWNLMADLRPFPQPMQKIEDNLYVFGQLRRSQNLWKKNNPVDNVGMSVYLYNREGEHYKGTCYTDSLGNYAFKLPDVEGEHTMQFHTSIDGKAKSYTVTIDRRFTPHTRYVSSIEAQQLVKPLANLFRMSDQERKILDEMDENDPLRRQIGYNEFLTKTVTVKKKGHYWTDYSGGWYNEKNATLHAQLYFDVDEVTDECIDKGEVVPAFTQWLSAKMNDLTYDPSEKKLPSDPNGFVVDKSEVNSSRPVVWILNNTFAGFSGITFNMDNEPINVLQECNHAFPGFIDEVNSVYVSYDPNAFQSYVVCSAVQAHNPITVFVYTHAYYTTASNKGVRRTHFQGFYKPQTFTTEDYGLLPAMDDFRRTLYWAPYLETDDSGKATLEFWNNSTCREMHVSAEGLKPEGGFVVSGVNTQK